MKLRFAYQPPGATPLPWRQILILCGVRLSEPINYSLIFPFINQMIVEETGVKVEDVGFYSGLIEGIFALVQCCVVYHWGSLSDRVGRRPVILCGLVGITVSGTSFGLSKSFWMMCLTRSMNGLLCGNVACIKASLGELTDETNQGVAFPVYGLTWVIGGVLGSTIGGYLSHPVERVPSLFGSSAFLTKYPFFLPCGVSGCISLCGFLFAFFFLEETLETPTHSLSSPTPPPSYTSALLRSEDEQEESHELLPSSPPSTSGSQSTRSHRRHPSSLSSVGGARSVTSDEFGGEWNFWVLIRLPLVKRIVLSTFLMSLIGGAFGAINLLVFYSPISEGGLGMTASQTGTSLALNGLWTLLSQIAFLPPLQTAFGIAPLYHYLNAGWTVIFFLLPMTNHLARLTGSTDANLDSPDGGGGSLKGVVWVCVGGTLMLSTVVNFASSINMILINASSPSRSALGKLNGITQMVGSLARSIGPALVSSLFAFSQSAVKTGNPIALGGNLWWAVMVGLAVVNGVVGFAVREGEGVKRVGNGGVGLGGRGEEMEMGEEEVGGGRKQS